MRLEFHAAEAGSITHVDPPARPSRRTNRLDPVELGVLAVFAALSLWVLGLDLWQVAVHGRVWTGTDGVYIVDQMQYLAWIREASHHVLAANLFVLRDTPADYFQPGVVISGLLTAVGVPPWVALLIWKPVAVVCVFFSFRALVHRFFADPLRRRTALVVAILFAGYTYLYGSWTVVGDLIPAFLSWGYTFGLLAVGLMVLSLLAYDRDRHRGRATVVPGVLGGVASLLHPWQGELLIVLLVAVEAVLWRSAGPPWRQRVRLLALTLAITGAALLYYALLGRADESWRLARGASKHSFPLVPIVIALVPLLVPAMLAWRPRRMTFLELLIRVWPLAALAIWLLSATALAATPLHAVQGLTLPLGILAVQGIGRLRPQRLPRPRAVLVAVLLAATVPGTVELLSVARDLAQPYYNNPNFITASEHRALRYLARTRRRGGVLTRSYLGTLVPAMTGRRTFVGDCLWSQPHCFTRVDIAQQLFTGGLSPARARAFVRQTGARFVLTDCVQPIQLDRTLGPLLVSVHRFGCSTVYELDAPAPPSGPLAESPRDAALRPSWRQ